MNHTHTEKRTLSSTLSLGARLERFLDYLQTGNVLTVNDFTWAWLDPERFDVNVPSSGAYNGLSIKASITRYGQEEEIIHLPQSDLSVAALFSLVEDITEEQWVGICGTLALQSMIPNRG